MDSDVKKYIIRWQYLCSRREFCESQVRRRLGLVGSNEQIDEIIDALKRDKFIDDNRFSMAYIKDKSRFAGWGIRKIESGLIQSGVSRDTVLRAIDEFLSSGGAEMQSDQLQKLAEQKWRSIKSASEGGRGVCSEQVLRAKLIRFLVGRGYDYGEVYSLAMRLA